jgi:putative two-component system response regulator
MLNDLINVLDGRILILDDEEIYLDLFSEVLKLAGFQHVQVFQCPQRAVAHYQTQTPDLVLLDLQMPALNGREVLHLLTDIHFYPMPPIIVLTADHGRQARIDLLKEGATDFLTKPVDAEELLYRVKNVLKMHLAHKESLQHNDTLDNLVQKRTSDLLKTQSEILERLGIAAEFKDKDTHYHTQRVGQYAGCLAKTFGFNADVTQEITITAPLHDIGKIGVPDSVLLKPGKLEANEWEQIKLHTIHGKNILKGSDSRLLKAAEVIALTHHERWDGQGYPFGLKNTEIHIYGRITSIADVYDALTMDRPYKPAWTHERAVACIVEGRGSQFDPELVDVFAGVENQFVEIASRLK